MEKQEFSFNHHSGNANALYKNIPKSFSKLKYRTIWVSNIITECVLQTSEHPCKLETWRVYKRPIHSDEKQ